MKKVNNHTVRDTMIAKGLLKPDAQREPMPVRQNVKVNHALSRTNAVLARRAAGF